MAARSLDVAQRQVLVDFFGDAAGFNWHARLLFHASPAADGKWVCATPDLDVELISLADHRVVPLGRATEIPQRYRAAAYVFDPLSDSELDSLARRARELAEILGFLKPGVQADPGARWRLADPSGDSFGESSLNIIDDLAGP